jgi:hypothetical protein
VSVAVVRATIAEARAEEEQLRKRAACETMDHTQLRAEFRALGVQNSFDGSTVEFMRSLLMRMYAGESAPAQLLCVDTIRQQRRAEYTRLLRSVSLEQLMTCLPEPLWQHYMSTKWLKTGLALTSKEKRMLALCHRVSFAELGVNPTDRATWQHARHVTNYDWSYGWQRPWPRFDPRPLGRRLA